MVVFVFFFFFFFYKLKICDKPAINKSVSAFFQQYLLTSCLYVYILVILTIFQTFYYYYICYGDLRLATIDVSITKRLRFTEGSDDG